MAEMKLTKEQYASITNSEKMLASALEELNKIERCGEDCTAAKEYVRQAQQKAAAVKREFAPNLLTE